MLRTVSSIVLRPREAGLMKLGRGIQNCLHTYPEKLQQSTSSFIHQKRAIEGNSLNKKVLEYMRDNPEYASSLKSSSDQFDVSSSINSFGGHQLLLVVAHGTEPRPGDILELFIQYATQKQNIIQDIISKRSLMSMLKEKVFQAIPLMTQDELKSFALIVKNMNFERSRYLIDIAARICQEYGNRAERVELEQCLELFDMVLLLQGNNIYRKKQFDIFMSLFESHINTATPHHLVQILHYLGLAKKYRLNKEYVEFLIKKLEEAVEHLSFIDAGIALTAVYKCNVKLDKSSSLIKKTAKWLQMKAEESETLSDLESFAFIAMIKVIRAAKYQDDALLSSMSAFIRKAAAATFQPQFIAHTLALYANSNVYDSEIFTKLESIFLKHLTSSVQMIRVKDISRILWCFSHVGHKGNDSFLDMIESALARLVQTGELEFHPEHLSSSLFSLAVLGHYPKQLITEAFQPRRIEKLKGYQKSKQLSRLMALHQAVKIEAPEINVTLPETQMNDLPKRTLSDEMLYRPALGHLKKGANFINQSAGSSVLEVKFPIPFINYASLVFDPRGLRENDSENFVLNQIINCKEITGAKRVALEVIDSSSLVAGRTDVIVIIEMKLRLMSQCGWIVQKVHEGDINSFNSDEHTMGAFILDVLSNLKV